MSADGGPSEAAARPEIAADEARALVQGLFFRPFLAALLRGAAQADLDLIVLKGAALAETLYPRAGLRPFGDLDVLVRPADAPRARRLLEGLGYAVAGRSWEALARGGECQANFFLEAPRGMVVVELHTDLLNNPFFRAHIRLDRDGLWARSRPATLAGESARVLGPEDQLLHLCLHLAGHYFSAPQSLKDADLVCRRANVSWPLFVRLARESGAARACFAALSVAASALQTPVPAEVQAGLRPARGAARLARLAARAAGGGASPERHRFALLWALLGTGRARRGAVRRTLLPPRGWLVSHYYHRLFDDPSGPGPSGPARRAWVSLALAGAHAAYLLGALARFPFKR